MKLIPGTSSALKFSKEIKKGYPPHVPETPKVLVVEGVISHWVVLKSIELGVYRDGSIANNVATRNVGVSEIDGRLFLTFQLIDEDTTSVALHDYRFEASLEFFSLL
jgi:hypothetical protein